ncbi:MAG: UPF0272 protein Cgl2470/cg2715 [Actinomycetota bacterium]|nr:MAG: UPF0272 protein Cgl2470/cg2715 [Actinomycetota bacterium]
MSRVAFVDAVGGAAGDMLLAALLDAGAPREPVAAAISAALGRAVELEVSEVRRGGLRAFAVRGVAPSARRRPSELLAAVRGADLAEDARSRALSVLERLLAAEARVHGLPLEELELEELGEDDTLFDVVGIAAALEALGIERLLVGPVPLPAPGPRGPHGAPVPVTLELLAGFAVRPGAPGLEEPVTPTAAAVLAALGEPRAEIPSMRLEGVGVGAGSRDPQGMANVVRVLVGDEAPEAGGSARRRLLVLEANVDDLTPELVPDAIEALLGAGAVDAWTTPIVMKRGRPALQVSALCGPEALDAVRRAFFEATTTLGVRVHAVERPELERRTVEVELAPGGPRVRVKIGSLEGRAVSAKPEHADVVQAATKLGLPVRAVHERASALARGLLEEAGA